MHSPCSQSCYPQYTLPRIGSSLRGVLSRGKDVLSRCECPYHRQCLSTGAVLLECTLLLDSRFISEEENVFTSQSKKVKHCQTFQAPSRGFDHWPMVWRLSHVSCHTMWLNQRFIPFWQHSSHDQQQWGLRKRAGIGSLRYLPQGKWFHIMCQPCLPTSH